MFGHTATVGRYKGARPPRHSHTVPRTRAAMNTALAVLALVAAAVAESPYHLPRPGGHAPPFNLPAPAPSPPQARPLPPLFTPQPQLSTGYQYQQPSFGPAIVQHTYQQDFALQRPQIAPSHFTPQPIQIAPAPLPQPGPSYGLPHSLPHIPSQAPVHYHPIIIPQHTPQPQFSQPITQPNFPSQQGYNYQRPLPRYNQQISVQAQPLINHISTSALSRYADTNQYNGAQSQTHRDALDSVVVGHLQNIIRDDEHSSARNAGYLSLVSGVNLESVKPSVEITSFVQNSPAFSGGFSHGPSSQFGPTGPSGSYGLPNFASNSHGSSSGSFTSESINFLPQNKPTQSYGPPN